MIDYQDCFLFERSSAFSLLIAGPIIYFGPILIRIRKKRYLCKVIRRDDLIIYLVSVALKYYSPLKSRQFLHVGNKQDAPSNVVYALKIHIPHGRELLFIPCTGSLEPQIEYSAVSRLYIFIRNMKNNALLVYLKELLSSLEEWCGDLKLILLWVVLGFLLGVFVDSCFVYVEHDWLMEEHAYLRG